MVIPPLGHKEVLESSRTGVDLEVVISNRTGESREWKEEVGQYANGSIGFEKLTVCVCDTDTEDLRISHTCSCHPGFT
jgi:hypothetical protein